MPDGGPSATIADVARRAQVSTATVSRALSGSTAVSPDTAARVRDAALRLGYRVNPIARALRKNATGNIGLLVPSVSNPFFTMLVDEVEKHLGGTGTNLYLCTSRDDTAIEAQRLASMCDGAVDGILISPCDTVHSGPALAQAQRKVPVVQLDRSAVDVDIDWVGLDDMHALEIIVAHLAGRGVRDLALVTSNTQNSSGRLRTTATRVAAANHGVTVADVLDGEFSMEWGAQAASTLVAAGPLPAAIVCADDQIATGLLRELARLGVSVPGDVLVTGLDDIPQASFLTPSLTTVRQPVSAVAGEAVRLIRSLLQPQAEPRRSLRTSLRGELVVRDSTSR
ncbi:LacI family transcriptional regulator [Nakamurella flavida]|uniref:LacI family DNA-binding transcriptional regulator n=1 Tax=Nakamurella flavida TaxID=363630 RepID=UPI002780753D|nr:LacI family DNA-binding transcriptional regulator [Nakamurella flavida]MDP9778530.1 LacI family transcriptional regulator [Nakamurella flavida]